MFLIMRKYKNVVDIWPTESTFGTDTPEVVDHSRELEHLLIDHFKTQELNDKKVEEATSRLEKWYVIIDGGHSNAAVKDFVLIWLDGKDLNGSVQFWTETIALEHKDNLQGITIHVIPFDTTLSPPSSMSSIMFYLEMSILSDYN